MNANGTGKQQVTTLGTVTTAGSWSPDGENLAFATDSLHTVKATLPFGSPVQMLGRQTNCASCDPTDPEPLRPIGVDRFLAWSTDGASIVVWNHDDAQVDDTVHMYYLATQEYRQIAGTGAECCGNHEWVDSSGARRMGSDSRSSVRTRRIPSPRPQDLLLRHERLSLPSQVTGGFVSAAGDTGAGTVTLGALHGLHQRVFGHGPGVHRQRRRVRPTSADHGIPTRLAAASLCCSFSKPRPVGEHRALFP